MTPSRRHPIVCQNCRYRSVHATTLGPSARLGVALASTRPWAQSTGHGRGRASLTFFLLAVGSQTAAMKAAGERLAEIARREGLKTVHAATLTVRPNTSARAV